MKRRRLILFPVPFQGHLNPMIQLARILHSAGGFDISVIHTAYNLQNPANYPSDFTFHLIDDGVSDSGAAFDSSDLMSLLKGMMRNSEEPFRRCLKKLVSAAEAEGQTVACVITDAVWSFAQAVTAELRIPRLVLRTSSAASLVAFHAVRQLRDQGYYHHMESRMEDPVEGLEPLKVKDLPTLENVNPNNLVEVVSNIMAATSEAAALILNTFEELEFSDMPRLHSRFHLPIFLIGPFHKRFSAATSTLFTHDPTSISWLDKQPPKSVLYVSFGSIAAMEAAHASIIASGLSESNQKFLWAIRPGSVRGSEWLEALDEQVLKGCSDRSHIVKWAPQQQVLSHPAVGGFWTHGGWNSTLESICEGVPMICSPFFGDQKGNSRYVSDVWKVGIRLENGFVKEDIVSAITRLMVEYEGEEMRRRAVCLKEKTDICLIPGGSSHQALDRLLKFISSLN